MLVSSMRSALLATVAATPLLATPAFAQDAFDLGEIIVSGSLTPLGKASTGATVEVLRGADTGANDSSVITRLDRLPGVNSTSSGGLGTIASIQIRGLPSRYVGVRINGINVSDPSQVQSAFNFGGLIASGIDRIEVLKGSQSALYGSETIGGVVAIQTFRPEQLGFSSEISAEAGSFNTYSGTLNLGYKTDRGEVALTYGRITSDGISALAADTEDDGFKQTTVTLSAEHAATDTLTIGGALYYRDGETEIDRSATDSSGINYLEETGARVFARLQTGAISHTFSYSQFDVDRRDPGAPIWSTKSFAGKRKELSYLGSAELGSSYTLNFGLDRKEETSRLDRISASDRTTSAQAELLYRPTDAIDVSAALRYDDNSDFGGKATGRLSAVWRPADDLTIRAVVGTGFRAPSLYERFSAYGDPALQPEQSRSFELGVEKSFGDAASVKATVFYTEIDDLIDFDGSSTACASGFGCYNQVPGKTKSKGIELSGDYAFNDALKVYGNYTYTDAKNEGARLTRTPRHDLAIGADGAFNEKLSGYVDVRYVADVLASPYAPAGHKVGDYTLVGMGLNYSLTDKATAYLRVENVLDKDYETAGGYNTPGRAAFLGIRAKF